MRRSLQLCAADAQSIKRKHVGSRPGGTTTTIVKAQDCSECPQLAAINDRQDVRRSACFPQRALLVCLSGQCERARR